MMMIIITIEKMTIMAIIIMKPWRVMTIILEVKVPITQVCEFPSLEVRAK